MRRSTTFLLALGLTLLVFGVAASSGAGSAPKITGSAHWEWPEWEMTGKVEINIIQLAQSEAKGHFNLIEKDPDLTHSFKAHAVCIAFGEGHYGEPAASFVLQFDRISGFNPFGDEVGQYIKLWLSDGGTPATEGDYAGGLIPYGVDDQPSCDYELPPEVSIWPLNDGGNIVIHPGN